MEVQFTNPHGIGTRTDHINEAVSAALSSVGGGISLDDDVVIRMNPMDEPGVDIAIKLPDSVPNGVETALTNELQNQLGPPVTAL